MCWVEKRVRLPRWEEVVRCPTDLQPRTPSSPGVYQRTRFDAVPNRHMLGGGLLVRLMRPFAIHWHGACAGNPTHDVAAPMGSTRS
jgi:hypothetical protein